MSATSSVPDAPDAPGGSVLAALADRSQVAVLIFDGDGRCTPAGAVALSSFGGHDATDLAGRALHEILPELGDGAIAELREVLATGRPLRRRVSGRSSRDRRDGAGDFQGEAIWFPVPAGGGDRGAGSVGLCLVAGGEDAPADAELAVVLERERVARETAERAQSRLAFLAEASRVLSAGVDHETLFDAVARLAVPRLADWAAVYVPEGDVLERVALGAADDDVFDLSRFVRRHAYDVDADTPVARAFRTGTVQTVGDGVSMAGSGMPAKVREALRELGVGATISVPVTSGRRRLAVLALAKHRDRGGFDADEVTLAEQVANRLCVALDRADHYEREHEVAQALVRATLPARLPRVAGVELAARYLPAGPNIDIGGDWYDAFRVDDALVLVLGDVAGHGITAATGTAQLRNAVRAYATAGMTPAEVLAAMARLTFDLDASAPETNVIATALVARYDPADATLTWASAGHPAAVIAGHGDVELLDEPRGPLLGAGRDISYEDGAVVVPPGGVVVLHSDGLIERRDEVLDEGRGRLLDAMARCRAMALEEMCDALLGELDVLHERDDDCCLLMLRRRPADG